MAWDHLSIDKPHVAYMILGGFTSLFMLCSLFVKEKLYIGEATVATLCGIIFGPHAANLFNPMSWGNVDKITLECSRIVLVVQCFAVGVELPKSYMNRHWKSVSLLLLPVMTFGWLVTSLFIWWMVEPLTWLESLACAACVTATDPVLASSVVGKGKFAKRVPKHLRDILSAESGCNDGMAFPFIYLSIYLIDYRPHASEVAYHWICFTILYECIFGAFFGFMIGYIARHAIKFAERRGLIDRESFLVFYFVLALFCAGSGSLLGMDDLLIGFAAGVGFSNDGWFTEKTEESHVSNVIDLLLNLAFFVYFGSIIPWEKYNDPSIGMVPWKLVVIALFVLFFRRIPIMMAIKPILPDLKTWREALFAGHFGPIGVGAIFAAILARAELEGQGTEPLETLSTDVQSRNYYVIQVIWPLTTFLVISSIIVHGSSIAVFTLGKRINTLTITMSYTQANEEGPSWMNRLPRVASMSKSSMSLRKADSTELSSDEKLNEYPPGTLPPIGLPGNFLRRQREEDGETNSRSSSRKPYRRRKGASIGGPISQSAIMPVRRTEALATAEEDESSESPERRHDTSSEQKTEGEPGQLPEIEVYQEGHNMVIEDEEGNVLRTEDISHESPDEQRQRIMEEAKRLQKDKSGKFAKAKGQSHAENEGEEIEEKIDEKIDAAAGRPYEGMKRYWSGWKGFSKGKEHENPPTSKPKERTQGSAHAYQFGNTVIVEDQDGEVVKKFTIPSADKSRKASEAGPPAHAPIRQRLTRMGTWKGKEEESKQDESDDEGLRFTVAGPDTTEDRQKRRMSKQDFINTIRNMDPKARRDMLQESDAPEGVKRVAKKEAVQQDEKTRGRQSSTAPQDQLSPGEGSTSASPAFRASPPSEASNEEREVPSHDVAATLARYSGHENSGAQARRRRLGGSETPTSVRSRRDSEDDGTERIPPAQLRQEAGLAGRGRRSSATATQELDNGETPAERKRRLAALGELGHSEDEDNGRGDDDASDSDDNGEPRTVKGKVQFADGTKAANRKDPADVNSPDAGEESAGDQSHRRHRPRVSWGGERGREK